MTGFEVARVRARSDGSGASQTKGSAIEGLKG